MNRMKKDKGVDVDNCLEKRNGKCINCKDRLGFDLWLMKYLDVYIVFIKTV